MSHRTRLLAAVAAVALITPPLSAAERPLAPCAWYRPYLGAGVGYYLPAAERGPMAEDLGYFAAASATPDEAGLLPRAIERVAIEPRRVDALERQDPTGSAPAGVDHGSGTDRRDGARERGRSRR